MYEKKIAEIKVSIKLHEHTLESLRDELHDLELKSKEQTLTESELIQSKIDQVIEKRFHILQTIDKEYASGNNQSCYCGFLSNDYTTYRFSMEYDLNYHRYSISPLYIELKKEKEKEKIFIIPNEIKLMKSCIPKWVEMSNTEFTQNIDILKQIITQLNEIITLNNNIEERKKKEIETKKTKELELKFNIMIQ